MPEILATLKKENVKATFFVLGEWAEKYPDVIKNHRSNLKSKES